MLYFYKRTVYRLFKAFQLLSIIINYFNATHVVFAYDPEIITIFE